MRTTGAGLLAALALLLAAGQGQAAMVVTGNIFEIRSALGTRIGSTVDHWGFHVNTAGTITIDIRSWEQDGDDLFDGDGNTTEFIDVNGDGEIAFFDPLIYLFRNDGSLDAGDLVALSDDDFANTYGDGSIFGFDSFLSDLLTPGDYILAIGSFFLSIDDAIDGQNSDPQYPQTTDFAPFDHGDYQITFDGDLTITSDPGTASAIPEPSSLALMGLGVGGLALGAMRRWRRRCRA